MLTGSQILDELIQPLFCPILQAPSKSLLVLVESPFLCGVCDLILEFRVVPCGHTFSPEGLHHLFQAAVLKELHSDRQETLAPYRKRVHGASNFYSEADFKDFNIFAHEDFLPDYRCPVCKICIYNPPLSSPSLNFLTASTVRLISETSKELANTVVDGLGDIQVDWKSYFIFFQ